MLGLRFWPRRERPSTRAHKKLRVKFSAVGLCRSFELPLLSGSQRFLQAAHDCRSGQGLLTKVGLHLFEVSNTIL